MKQEQNNTGKLGEDIAELFLVKRGFSILKRNYSKRYGEIDVVAEYEGVIHFVEVKSSVSQETELHVKHPEERVSRNKLKKLSNTILAYLIEHGIGDNEWQFDVVSIVLHVKLKQANVRYIANISLE